MKSITQMAVIALLSGIWLQETSCWAAHPSKSRARDDVSRLAKRIESGDAADRLSAINGLHKVDSVPADLVPVLKSALLRDKNAQVRAAAAFVLYRIPEEAVVDALLTAIRNDCDIGVRKEALRSIGAMGHKAKKAIPELIRTLRNPSSYMKGGFSVCFAGLFGTDCLGCRAAYALVGIGSDSSVGLAETAVDKQYDKVVRLTAIKALTALGWEGRAAVDSLVQVVRDEDQALKVAALWALARVSPTSLEVKRAILGALADTSSYVRAIAASILFQLDETNVISVPVLIQLIDDPDRNTQVEAISQLGAIGAKATAAIPKLIRILDAEEPQLRWAVSNALRDMGPLASDALPSLRKLLKDSQVSVRTAAARAIRAIKPE